MATMPTDPTSPTYWCDLAAYLREAYYTAVGGGNESLIRDRGPDSEQEVRFAKMDLATLRDELRRAEEACAAASGQVVKRRFAITAGSRRIYTPPRG